MVMVKIDYLRVFGVCIMSNVYGTFTVLMVMKLQYTLEHFLKTGEQMITLDQTPYFSTYGTFYCPNGNEVTVYTGTFPQDRRTNDYTGPDPIFQTDDQLVYTILLRDEDSTKPITSDYEGLYKCIIDCRTPVVGVYNTSTYNHNSELMISCVVIVYNISIHLKK